MPGMGTNGRCLKKNQTKVELQRSALIDPTSNNILWLSTPQTGDLNLNRAHMPDVF